MDSLEQKSFQKRWQRTHQIQKLCEQNGRTLLRGGRRVGSQSKLKGYGEAGGASTEQSILRNARTNQKE